MTKLYNNSSNNNIMSSNQQYINNSALQIRLETKELIEKIEVFLSGIYQYPINDEKTGKIIIKQAKKGERLMNDEGVSHIVNYVSAIINPSVVQGNYDEEWYRDRITTTHKNLAYLLVINTYDWEIKTNARHSIIGFIMELVIPFLSRLIDNKERESYVATIKSVENSNTITRDSGFLSKASI